MAECQENGLKHKLKTNSAADGLKKSMETQMGCTSPSTDPNTTTTSAVLQMVLNGNVFKLDKTIKLMKNELMRKE